MNGVYPDLLVSYLLLFKILYLKVGLFFCCFMFFFFVFVFLRVYCLVISDVLMATTDNKKTKNNKTERGNTLKIDGYISISASVSLFIYPLVC